MPQNLWTKDELVLTLNLYFKLPFGKFHRGNPEVVRLAGLIERTPSAVAMRLSNFAAVDPYHQQRGVGGLSGGIKQVEPIWNEFLQNKEELIFQSEKLLAEKEHQTLEEKFPLEYSLNLKGEMKERLIKTRVNQSVFRQMVLSNYESKCAISKINIPAFLIASHIIPWPQNEQERLNPENGICRSPLYDKAFDSGFIGINGD